MLTTKQLAVLRAAVDRIIPPDDFPGGWDAGVGEYLLGQFGRDLRPLLTLYQGGLDALDAEAVALAGTGFAALDAPAQDALLARAEAGEVMTSWPVSPAVFLRVLVVHVMEGYYGDPGNEGNRDGASWKMIGFEVRG